MRLGAIAATAVNVLLLTFFILSSLQTPISSRRLFRLGRSLRADDHPEVALPRQLTVQPAESSFRPGAASEVSYFMPWIRQDFQRWSSSGISWVSPSVGPQALADGETRVPQPPSFRLLVQLLPLLAHATCTQLLRPA